MEIASVFTRLGFTAFGGPMAHVALMEDEIVTKRRWCDKQRFLDTVAAVNFIPGPNSTELAIHMGFVRGGFPGLVVAGACFITPAVLIILPIAFVYVRYGALPQVQPVLHTVAAAIIAIIAVACIRLAKQALRDPFAIAIGVITLAMLLMHALGMQPVTRLLNRVQPEIVLLALSAVLGLLWKARSSTPAGTLAALPLGDLSPGSLAITTAFDSRWTDMLWFFFKVGATLFGSGYVLASFLQSGLVDARHWLTTEELNHAIAVGQFTPGPLLTTATFIGYVLGYRGMDVANPGASDTAGVLGAFLATAAIFAPSFLFVALLAPVLDRLRKSQLARGALDAMNASVVVLIGFTVWTLGRHALTSSAGGLDVINLLIAVVSIGLMLWRDVNATWLVLGAIAVGAARVAIGV